MNIYEENSARNFRVQSNANGYLIIVSVKDQHHTKLWVLLATVYGSCYWLKIDCMVSTPVEGLEIMK